MSRLSDARQRLFDGLSPAFPEGRVQKVSPPNIAAPTVWIDSPTITMQAAGQGFVTVATFPVYCVVDGSEQAQSLGLDDMVATVWDKAHIRNGQPTRTLPQTLDVGGPNLRCSVVDVDITLTGRTLCDPSQEGQP